MWFWWILIRFKKNVDRFEVFDYIPTRNQIMKKYAISFDEEDWSEECYGTREEAIQAGIGEWMGDIFWVGEARQPEPPETFFYADNWIEEVGEFEDYEILQKKAPSFMSGMNFDLS